MSGAVRTCSIRTCTGTIRFGYVIERGRLFRSSVSRSVNVFFSFSSAAPERFKRDSFPSSSIYRGACDPRGERAIFFFLSKWEIASEKLREREEEGGRLLTLDRKGWREGESVLFHVEWQTFHLSAR